MKYRSRFQSGLTMLTGLFLLAALFAIFLYALYFVVRSGVRDGILQADKKRSADGVGD